MSSGLIYRSCLYDTLSGGINFQADRFGVMLCTKEYEPDLKAHTRRSDVYGEVEAEGYKPGGLRASVAIDYSADGEGLDISLGGARWSRADINAGYAVYFRMNGGDPSDDELVAVIDFERNVVSSGGTFVLSESTIRVGA